MLFENAPTLPSQCNPLLVCRLVAEEIERYIDDSDDDKNIDEEERKKKNRERRRKGKQNIEEIKTQ